MQIDFESDKEYKSRRVDEILKIIDSTHNESDEEQLSDENLYPKYLEARSTKKRKESLSKYLRLDLTDKNEREVMLDFIIPPGLKGAIRGRQFEEIMKKRLLSFASNLQIFFNKPFFFTDEIPDVILTDGKKTLVLMLQVDLWSGGAQRNRAHKYIKHKQTDTEKVVAVVCKKPTKTEIENPKMFDLFDFGFAFNTICFSGGLENLIKDFFMDFS